MNILILFLAFLFLPGLLYYEKRENAAGILPLKTTMSVLFIIAVLIQNHTIPGYYRLILAGLVFCLGGDIFLALPQKKMFTIGLVSFLVGHAFYLSGFFQTGSINLWTWIGFFVTAVISVSITLWLKPYLGYIKILVFIYVTVISLMLIGAFSILGNDQLGPLGRFTAFAGAVILYFSDIFMARNRFVKNAFLNRVLGLPMYYLAQFLLAFSVGLMK